MIRLWLFPEPEHQHAFDAYTPRAEGAHAVVLAPFQLAMLQDGLHLVLDGVASEPVSWSWSASHRHERTLLDERNQAELRRRHPRRVWGRLTTGEWVTADLMPEGPRLTAFVRYTTEAPAHGVAIDDSWLTGCKSCAKERAMEELLPAPEVEPVEVEERQDGGVEAWGDEVGAVELVAPAGWSLDGRAVVLLSRAALGRHPIRQSSRWQTPGAKRPKEQTMIIIMDHRGVESTDALKIASLAGWSKVDTLAEAIAAREVVSFDNTRNYQDPANAAYVLADDAVITLWLEFLVELNQLQPDLAELLHQDEIVLRRWKKGLSQPRVTAEDVWASWARVVEWAAAHGVTLDGALADESE